MEWAQVLVIILSVFLAIFLILAIVLIVLLIKVTRQIKRVTSTAERTVNGIEHVVANITKFSSPLAIAKLVAGQVKNFKKRK